MNSMVKTKSEELLATKEDLEIKLMSYEIGVVLNNFSELVLLALTIRSYTMRKNMFTLLMDLALLLALDAAKSKNISKCAIIKEKLRVCKELMHKELANTLVTSDSKVYIKEK